MVRKYNQKSHSFKIMSHIKQNNSDNSKIIFYSIDPGRVFSDIIYKESDSLSVLKKH